MKSFFRFLVCACALAFCSSALALPTIHVKWGLFPGHGNTHEGANDTIFKIDPSTQFANELWTDVTAFNAEWEFVLLWVGDGSRTANGGFVKQDVLGTHPSVRISTPSLDSFTVDRFRTDETSLNLPADYFGDAASPPDVDALAAQYESLFAEIDAIEDDEEWQAAIDALPRLEKDLYNWVNNEDYSALADIYDYFGYDPSLPATTAYERLWAKQNVVIALRHKTTQALYAISDTLGGDVASGSIHALDDLWIVESELANPNANRVEAWLATESKTATIGMSLTCPGGHTLYTSDARMEPTCTVAGHTAELSCSVCGEIITASETLAALGHVEYVSQAAVASTCTTAGSTAEISCSRCHEVVTASEAVALLPHTTYTSKAAVTATCTTAGSTAEISCSTCHQVITASQLIRALGHSYYVSKDPIYATYDSEGCSEEISCSRCEQVIYESTVLPRLELTPQVSENASPEEIYYALMYLADTRVCSYVTDYESYLRFSAWVESIEPTVEFRSDIAYSTTLWPSYVLGQYGLLTSEITGDELAVFPLAPTAGANAFDFSLSISGVDVGPDAVLDAITSLFSFEGCTGLGDGFSEGDVSLNMNEPENGLIRFSAGPHDDAATSFFLRVTPR